MVYETKLDKNANKELNRKNIISWLFVLLIGLLVLAYGVISSLYSLIDSFWCSTLMVVGMLFISFALICIIIIIKMGKSQEESNNVLVYDFCKQYVIVKTKNENKIIEEEKVYYKYIIRTRKTKNYIYIYRSNNKAIPFCITNVEENDLKKIENYFSQANK